GTYRVVATNSAGSATSNGAVLTVNSPGGPPPTITQQPIATLNVNSGTTVALNVSTTGATGYQWKKGSTNVAGGTAPVLILTNVSSADSGSYTVVVSNGGGSVTSSATTLNVVTPQNNRISNLSVRTPLPPGQTLTVAW